MLSGPWFRFVLGVLATWRIAHLFAEEDGPFDVVVRFRSVLGDGFFGRMLDCFYCLSMWVAAPVAFFVGRTPVELVFTWLALSGAACLLERVSERKPMERAESLEGEMPDVLWSKKSGFEE